METAQGLDSSDREMETQTQLKLQIKHGIRKKCTRVADRAFSEVRVTWRQPLCDADMLPPNDATNFDIPAPLWRVLQECETHCVGGCCGRDAFNFAPEVVRYCVTVPDRDLLSVARQQLDELIAALEAIPGPVDTFMITDTWTGPDAARWFADFRQVFDAALGDVA